MHGAGRPKTRPTVNEFVDLDALIAAGPRRLAVLGQPVAHSKSPALHGAAYDVLGLPWSYDAIELPADALAGFLATLDDEWRGLSLTMPHKQVVLPLLDSCEPLVALTGAANSVLFDADGMRRGYNTDVAGIVASLREVGAGNLTSAAIVGSGATSASALAAVARLGAQRVTIVARNRERALELKPLAEELDVVLAIRGLDAAAGLESDHDAVVSTLPGGAADALQFPIRLRRNAALLDAAYSDGDTVLARHWREVDGVVATGRHMLYHQAVEQVRIFVTGGVGVLPRETEVRAAMRVAVGV